MSRAPQKEKVVSSSENWGTSNKPAESSSAPIGQERAEESFDLYRVGISSIDFSIGFYLCALNIRPSNRNGFGSAKTIFFASGCSGFTNAFHSSCTAADGTSNTKERLEAAHADPINIRSSCLSRRQSDGKRSNPIRSHWASSSGNSASMETRWSGVSSGPRWTNASIDASANEVAA